VKRRDANGFDTLADLGFAALPTRHRRTPRAAGCISTSTRPKHREIRNTTGDRGRGIGRGLDWRGTGGHVVVPSPNGGY
jgi:hypothetical protein